MSGGVDQPSEVQGRGVPEDGGVPGVHGVLAPEVAGYPRRNEEAEYRHEDDVQSSLPNDYGIGFHVAHVYLGSLLDDVGMLADQQPAHVGEEEASFSVVRVGVGVCELVVHSVISDPFVQMVLKKNSQFFQAIIHNHNFMV